MASLSTDDEKKVALAGQQQHQIALSILEHATQASMHNAVGAFAVAGPGSTINTNTSASSDDDEEHQHQQQQGGEDDLRRFSATLVSSLRHNDADTLGLGWDEEAPHGGALDDSASVAVSAITTPHTPTVAEGQVNPLELEGGVVGVGNNNEDRPPPLENIVRGVGRARQAVEGVGRAGSNNVMVDEVPTATAVTTGDDLEADCEPGHAPSMDPTGPMSLSSRSDGDHPATGREHNDQDGGMHGIEPVKAQKMDKHSIYAFGRQYDLTKWHFMATFAACLAVILCVAIPVGIVVNNNTNKNEDNAMIDGTSEPPEPVLMKVPGVNLTNQEECEYPLYENNSTFNIESIHVNDELVVVQHQGSDNEDDEGSTTATKSTTTIIAARPGSKIRFKGTAMTCSTWCPSCIVQLYISLMDYDNGNLYNACKYMWAGQVVLEDFAGAEDEPYDLVRPPRDATTDCFTNQGNSDCGIVDFDEELVLDEEMYPEMDDSNVTSTYAVVLSLSYEYLCQSSLADNKLKLLDVSNEYFVKVEGDPIVEIEEEEKEGGDISIEECEYQLNENTNSTFDVDAVYVNDEPVSNGSITAKAGDTVRVKGTASTCSNWCPGCVVQLYISLMDYDNGSLYNPCKYMWAAQIVDEDFTGADDELSLIRPPFTAATSQCFVSQSNGNCTVLDFDEEFVLDAELYGDDSSIAKSYGFVLSNSYEFYCQDQLLENKLKILGVSNDYLVEVKGECEYQLNDENNSTFNVEAVYLNDEPAIAEEGTSVTAMAGDTVRVKGTASTCSSWCPGCFVQLHISLMDYDDGSLYDACKYMWAAQVVDEDFTGAEDEPYLIQPSTEATSQCFVNQNNWECNDIEFDEEFVLDAELYGNVGDGSAKKFAFVLSSSYEWDCQGDAVEEKNSLKILGISEDHFVEVKNDQLME